jgi:hypothetical protein
MKTFSQACAVVLLLGACSSKARPAASPPNNPNTPEQQNPVPPAGPAPAAPDPNSTPNLPSERRPPDGAPKPPSEELKPSTRLDDQQRFVAGNLIASTGALSTEDAELLLVPGDRVEDFRIHAELRRALMADERLSHSSKQVAIHAVGGEVALRGVVRTQAERQVILEVARRIAGGEHVHAWIEIRR